MPRPRPVLPPGFIVPMAPTLVEAAPDGNDWLHEIKYDGYRTQVVVKDGTGKAFTRNGHDWSDKYAPIVAASLRLPCRSVILDGEVIVQNPEGKSDHAALLKAVRSQPHRLVFYAFDVLNIDGTDLRRLPCIERREHLANLIVRDPKSPLHRTTHFVGGGPHVFALA